MIFLGTVINKQKINKKSRNMIKYYISPNFRIKIILTNTEYFVLAVVFFKHICVLAEL